jgi:hypothetical protein
MRLAFGGDASAGAVGRQRAGAQEAADLAAFLGRLVRWDKAAVVRLRSAEGEAALGVFGHPPFGGVLAVKSLPLRAGGGDAAAVDATVSAGQLLEAVAAAAEDGDGEFALPGSVTGPAWAGLLPPRGGWRRIADLDAVQVRGVAAGAVAEFRSRTEVLGEAGRTRAGLDALAEELWAREAGPGGLTLRVVHAAHGLGFLREAAPGAVVSVLAAGPWVRLRTEFGSVAARTQASGASGLTVSPV